MIDLNDFELERTDEAQVTPAPPRRTTHIIWASSLAAAILIAGGVWYFTTPRTPATPPSVSVPAVPTVIVPERLEAPLVKAEDIDLPPLQQTDPIVRELISRLSSHPKVAAWLATKGLIANFTVVTLNIAAGKTPTQLLRPLAPRGPFRTVGSGEDLFADPRNYTRYNPYADAVSALDAAGTASLYLTLKPRITDAYSELGYPDGDFDRVLERAIGVLVQTPAIDEGVPLRPKSVTYGFTDPRLESLPSAQKQLLRMGPRNGQAIRAKLEEIATLLRLNPAAAATR